MRLREFWVDIRRVLKMAFRFCQVALLEKQASQINLGIEQTRIQSQRLSVVRNCFVDFAVLFQECAIAVMRLSRFGRQSNGGFTLRRRLLVLAEFLQKISIARVILSIIRLNSQRLFKMGLRLVQFSLLN